MTERSSTSVAKMSPSGPPRDRPMHAPVKQKYNMERPSCTADEQLTPSEQAVFELVPEA